MTTTATMADAPPDPAVIATIAAARERGNKVVRAASVATFSGWSLAVFAVPTLLAGLFSLPGFLLGLALSIAAWIELRGARRLRHFDASAGRMLGLNQIGLGIALFLYGCWGIANTLLGESPYAEHLAAGGQVAEALAPIDNFQRLASVIFYVFVIVASDIATGCMSLYYFSRSHHVRTFTESTPEWVVDTMRAAA